LRLRAHTGRMPGLARKPTMVTGLCSTVFGGGGREAKAARTLSLVDAGSGQAATERNNCSCMLSWAIVENMVCCRLLSNAAANLPSR